MQKFVEVWEGCEGCGGVWRGVEVCGGVWRGVEVCGGVCVVCGPVLERHYLSARGA